MSYVFGKRYGSLADVPALSVMTKGEEGTTPQPVDQPSSSSGGDVLSSISSGLSNLASSVASALNPSNWFDSSPPTPPADASSAPAADCTASAGPSCPYWDPTTNRFVATCPSGRTPNDKNVCKDTSSSPVVPIAILGAAGVIAYFALRKKKGRR